MEATTGTPKSRGGRRKGSGRLADASAPWAFRAVQALADPSRWSIIEYLSNSESTIGQLAHALGLSVACMSRHVAILREAGVVRVERRGREAACRLAAPGSDGGRLLLELGIEDHAPILDRPAPAASTRPAPGSATPELDDAPRSRSIRYRSNDIDDFLL